MEIEAKTPEALRRKLDECPSGSAGWRKFEDVCIEILAYLFVPPLSPPIIQARTLSGTERRDALFPNRNMDATNHWGHIFKELDARMVLAEFKNYDSEEIGKEEVNQARNYLKKTLGRLALLVVNKEPDQGAHITRNSAYSEEGKVILFVTREHLKEMLYMKDRGQEPSDLIMDLIELFYVGYE